MQTVCGSLPHSAWDFSKAWGLGTAFNPKCGPNLGIRAVAGDLDPHLTIVPESLSGRDGGWALKAGNNGY